MPNPRGGYLVGNKTLSIDKLGGSLIAHIGGGYVKFENFIKDNHQKMAKELILKMISSKKSLEWIIEAYNTGLRIPSLQSYGSTPDLKAGGYLDPMSSPSPRKDQKLMIFKKEILMSPDDVCDSIFTC